MNPHPLPPPALGITPLNQATIAIMVSLTFLMQASAILFNSFTVREYRGVKLAFAATIALSLSFAFLFLHNALPAPIPAFSSNIVTMTGYLLLYIAICQFAGKPVNQLLTYILAPLGYLAFLILALLPGSLPIIFVTELVDIPLLVGAAQALIGPQNRRYHLGAYLTAIPLLSYGVLSVVRVVNGMLNIRTIAPGPSLSNTFDALSLFVLSFLWTAGFILMISQRLQSDLNDLAMNDVLTRVRNRRAMLSLLNYEM